MIVPIVTLDAPIQSMIKVDGHWYINRIFPFMHYEKPYLVIGTGTEVYRWDAPEKFPLLPTDLKPGIMKRPSASQLAARNEPPEVREAKQAMKEALDKMPEMQI